MSYTELEEKKASKLQKVNIRGSTLVVKLIFQMKLALTIFSGNSTIGNISAIKHILPANFINKLIS